MPRREQICIAKCLYSLETFAKKLEQNDSQECKTTYGWRALLKKRLCLSSLLPGIPNLHLKPVVKKSLQKEWKETNNGF